VCTANTTTTTRKKTNENYVTSTEQFFLSAQYENETLRKKSPKISLVPAWKAFKAFSVKVLLQLTVNTKACLFLDWRKRLCRESKSSFKVSVNQPERILAQTWKLRGSFCQSHLTFESISSNKQLTVANWYSDRWHRTCATCVGRSCMVTQWKPSHKNRTMKKHDDNTQSQIQFCFKARNENFLLIQQKLPFELIYY
jgi:hypothetical protein